MSLKTIAVSLGAVYASRGIFLDVIQAIMKTSMSFFDQTPRGRILNVLGKDIDTVDNAIPTVLQNWSGCFSRVIHK